MIASDAAISPHRSDAREYPAHAARNRRPHRRALEELVQTTELDFLFDRNRHLFDIGYNVTEGRRDATYTTARVGSAPGQLRRHRDAACVAGALVKLGRLMTPVGNHRALVSWSASMFEYLMPLLVMRSYPRTR